MKSSHTLLAVLLLLPISSVASAEILHVSEDPNPETRRCSNAATAFHANDDVVLVDYHGQWLRHDNGRRSQNGGLKGRGCEVERIVRVDVDQNVVWEIKPTHSSQASLGLARQDQVSSLLAMPKGQTLMTTTGNFDSSNSNRHVSVVLYDASGKLLWRFKNSRGVKFSSAKPFVGRNGEVFISYHTTNYAYAGGKFQLPAGRSWSLRKNQQLSLIVRLNAKDGRLMWEQAGANLVSADGGELLALKSRVKKGRRFRMRHEIRRISYAGKRLARALLPWTPEALVLAIRFGNTLAFTSSLEIQNPRTRKVDHRVGRLRMYTMQGKLLLVRKVSDGSVLAQPTQGAPMRMLSPTNCVSRRDYSCQTDVIGVLSFQSAKSRGVYSRILLPGKVFENDGFAARSHRDGLWLNALTSGRKSGAPSVARLYSRDDQRPKSKAPGIFVWRPRPRVVRPPSRRGGASLLNSARTAQDATTAVALSVDVAGAGARSALAGARVRETVSKTDNARETSRGITAAAEHHTKPRVESLQIAAWLTQQAGRIISADLDRLANTTRRTAHDAIGRVGAGHARVTITLQQTTIAPRKRRAIATDLTEIPLSLIGRASVEIET